MIENEQSQQSEQQQETLTTPPPQDKTPSLIGEEKKLTEESKAPKNEFVPLAETDIKVPEGFELDKDMMSKYLGIMNNQELNAAERSQQLVDLYAGATKAASERISAAFTEMQQQWQEEVFNDKEYGGDKLEPVLGRIDKLLVAYGSPELRQVLAGTGAGNSIHLVRFLAKISDQLSEGTPLPGGATSPQVSLAEKLYPTMSKGN